MKEVKYYKLDDSDFVTIVNNVSEYIHIQKFPHLKPFVEFLLNNGKIYIDGENVIFSLMFYEYGYEGSCEIYIHKIADINQPIADIWVDGNNDVYFSYVDYCDEIENYEHKCNVPETLFLESEYKILFGLCMNAIKEVFFESTSKSILRWKNL